MYHYVSISIILFLYSIYSKVPVILPITWKEIGTHFDDIGHETVPIQGDEFCFITSLVKAMKSEHNIILEKSEAQDLIIDQAIENCQQYSLYHYKTLTEKESLNNTDSFMSELIDFFNSRDFMCNVVDLIIQIAADALGLNIYIYQENILRNEENSTEESRTEVIKMSGGQLCKDVYMKFIHNNNINVQGNHYEPLLKTEE